MTKYKKVLCVLLMGVVSCMFAGCSSDVKNEVVETETITTETIETSEVQMEELPAASNPDGLTLEELPDELKAMLVPIDSIMLSGVESGVSFSSDDSEKFWNVMHYAIVNFGEAYNRAEFEVSELAAKSDAVAEFGSSLVEGFEGLPAIPDSLSDRMRYDSESDTYFFAVGDRGLSQTEILSYEYMDMDTVKVSARLFAQDDDSTICEGEFTLVRNVYTVSEPLFSFSVSEVGILGE